MLSKKLKAMREQYDITIQRLADYMKVNEEDIIDWETGTKEPTISQLHTLCDLYDITFDELLNRQETGKKDAKQKKDKNKTKHKKKTKHKTKRKNKKVKQKTVEKKRNWPFIVLMILLIAALCMGGFLYWKYGDEYDLMKKKNYTVEELSGVFVDETSYGDFRSKLTLNINQTYALENHDCSIASYISGTWSIDKDKLTLTLDDGKAYSITVKSKDKLKFQEDLGCSPKQNDIFKREITKNETKESQDEEVPVNTSQSYIESGQWSGNHTTLIVHDVSDQQATFTLQSYDPDHAENVAKLEHITGTISNHTISFHFDDDGYGNAGEGTIVFDETQAVFNIQFTHQNPDAVYAVVTSGTLSK